MIGISEAEPPVATVMPAALPPDLRRPLTWRTLPSAKARPLTVLKRRAPTVAVSWAVMAPAMSSSEAEVVAPSVAAVGVFTRVAPMTWAEALMAAKLAPLTK